MKVICNELNSVFEDMVFFGDEVDQETAHNANMDYVHFLFGYGDLGRVDATSGIQCIV